MKLCNLKMTRSIATKKRKDRKVRKVTRSRWYRFIGEIFGKVLEKNCTLYWNIYICVGRYSCPKEYVIAGKNGSVASFHSTRREINTYRRARLQVGSIEHTRTDGGASEAREGESRARRRNDGWLGTYQIIGY